MLRDYQNNILSKIVNRYNSGVKNQLLKLCTGGGKTVVFANLKNYTGWAGKVLIIVHREELAQQAKEKILHWNPGAICMIEMGNNRALIEMCDFVVAGVQTLSNKNRLEKFDPREFCAVVVDEAHHATAPSYRKILEYFRNGNLSSLRLGVTATPNRADGEGLGSLFDEIVEDYGIDRGTEDGWLVPLIGQQIRTTTNLDSVHTKYGDFNVTELDKIANTPTRNLEIVNGWKQYGQGRQTVDYCISIENARKLSQCYADEGVPSDYIYGNDPLRAEKLKRHREGDIVVLTNCEVLTEGHDDWAIACIGMARPTKSESLYAQMIGRGTRIDPLVGNMLVPKVKPRKTDCLVLDYTDNSDKHSLISLASLFGVPKNVKIKGKPVAELAKKYKQIKDKYPTIDFSNVEEEFDSIEALETYAKQVNLFQVKWSPEVIQHSKYKWYKVDGNYITILKNKESLKINHDKLLDRYNLSGRVNNNIINESVNSFRDAVMLGDYYIESYGGRAFTEFIKRETKWSGQEPTEKQLKACKWLGIAVPAGATKGEVHSKIAQAMAERINK